MRGFKTPSGVSWLDVADTMREFRDEFQCNLELGYRVVTNQSTGRVYLRVTATAGISPYGTKKCWQRQYHLDWPSHQNRTMAGFVLRLIWEFAESLRVRPPILGEPVKVPFPPCG